MFICSSLIATESFLLSFFRIPSVYYCFKNLKTHMKNFKVQRATQVVKTAKIGCWWEAYLNQPREK